MQTYLMGYKNHGLFQMHYVDEKCRGLTRVHIPQMTNPAEESGLKVKESEREHTVFTEFGWRGDCVL